MLALVLESTTASNASGSSVSLGDPICSLPVAMTSSHSPTSSLADFDYYGATAGPHSHSRDSSAYSSSSANPPPLRTTQSQQSGSSSTGVRKQTSLANISVPSFSAFRNQVSGIPVSSPSNSVKRKPAPGQSQSSPRVVSFSAAEKASPRLAEPGSRPYSLESPAIQQPSGLASVISPPLTEDDTTPQGERYGLLSQLRKSLMLTLCRTSFPYPIQSHDRNDSIDSRIAPSNRDSSAYNQSRRSSIPVHARYAQEQTISHAPKQSVSSISSTSQYSDGTGPMTAVQRPPNMRLEFEGVQRTLSDESLRSTDSDRAKSPGGRLGNIFGWKSSSQRSGVESPTTTFSDHSQSPQSLPSPRLQKPPPMDSNGKLTPPGLDVQKANNHQPSYFDNPETPILIGTPVQAAHVKELERELSQVSQELAESIRREMELEDEVERLRIEAPNTQPEQGRRGSDYFSDSGASSTRFPIADPDGRMADLEKSLRKVEQEKAQIKNDMASRLQSELSRRRDLEQMVQKMEEQLSARFDEESVRDMSERVEELESTLEDTRRLLNQERQAKGSFEDLYTATREDLEQSKNERDNLRDEVVPQLKARVEGLEAEAADTQALMYENTRMAQELAGLKEKYGGRFGMIAEEGEGMSSPMIGGRAGLSRSNSLARTGSKRGGSIGRSGSVKDREGGRARSGSLTGPLNADAVKEIEDQRDALHKALQLLISRYEKQQKEHTRAVKKLTTQKNIAEHASPGRSAYHKEVSFLKEEVTTLRKRTEDALEQKWEYEKGLSGIKMDLDRAEQETRGLRILLQENDILAPSPNTLLSDHNDSNGPYDRKLSVTISMTESERDEARRAAEEYRQRAKNASNGSAQQLLNSAKRMDELADQLDAQVQSNSDLRERLSQAVAKGEKEQKETSGKIEEMQKRLAGMEDSVLAAQQHSETTLTNHEGEVRRIDEATSPSLQRLKIHIPDPTRLSPHSPHLARSPLATKTPKLGGKKLADTSLLEASRTQMLERKVRELEGLLREAEQDVQDVVQRVNASQLEVAELQTQRDAAMGQMRKLAGLVGEERGRVEGLM